MMPDTLHEAFGQLGMAKPSGGPSHPQEFEILRQAKEILFELPTGRQLVEFANSYNVPVKTMLGKEPDFSSLDGKSVLLVSPAKIENYIKELSLCLACGYKIVQNHAQGFIPTDAAPDTLEWKNEQAGKLLDIIILMCKLAEELVAVKKDTKFVDLIKRLGHSDIYEASLKRAPYEELEKIMLKSINK